MKLNVQLSTELDPQLQMYNIYRLQILNRKPEKTICELSYDNKAIIFEFYNFMKQKIK
jgi:hypothetical protein